MQFSKSVSEQNTFSKPTTTCHRIDKADKTHAPIKHHPSSCTKQILAFTFLSVGLQMLLLQGQGYGEDVESVENLIRRHEEMEREVRVIQDRSTVSIP